MGAYLSEPLTEKVSSDEAGKYVKCGASSMQGWRISQEDAHNCIIDYDENISLFAVYDGHGGHEVAQYCSQNLPNYLKECASYKSGKHSKALEEAFLGFDATLIQPDIVAILKQIAKSKDDDDENRNEENQNSGSEDEENIQNLFEEAQMPLEEVMAKYQADPTNPKFKKLKALTPPSPFLLAKQQSKRNVAQAGPSSEAGSSTSFKEPASESSSSGKDDKNGEESRSEEAGSITTNGEKKETNGEESAAGENVKMETETSSEPNIKQQVPEKAEGNEMKKSQKQEVNGSVEKCDEETGSKPLENGDVADEETDEDEEVKETSEKSKGKGKAVVKKPEMPKRTSARMRSVNAIMQYLFTDSESDDDGDESFQGAEESSSNEDEDAEKKDGEEEEEEEEEEGEEEEEEEDEDGEEEEEDDDEGDLDCKLTEEPGVDSGCTAVVALLQGRDLYVANAGDSRCVVCRGGEAFDMSLDHKPEDKIENQRIVAAGGYVTFEGRVKGGLNLSRAIGDHAYKQTKNMPPEEQMITALPDVRTFQVDPKQDEFMILACDGIWNFMSSQDVVNFVRTRLKDTPDKKLSTICEELFDYCLAPHTAGDGTGCDNMTAIIVQFLPTLTAASSNDVPNTAVPASVSAESQGSKSPVSPSEGTDENQSIKRSASPLEDDAVVKRAKKEDGAEDEEKKEGDGAVL